MWAHVQAIPDDLAGTELSSIDAAGIALSGRARGRIIVSGTGAGYHAALGFWLASLQSRDYKVVVIPARTLAREEFCWRNDDSLVIFTAGGTPGSIDERLGARGPGMLIVVTAEVDSPLKHRADITVCVRRSAYWQREIGDFSNLFAASLKLWASLAKDASLAHSLLDLPELFADRVAEVERSSDRTVAIRPEAAIAFAAGLAWPGALETAQLLHRVCGIPAEGLEAREVMHGPMVSLNPRRLGISIRPEGDRLTLEAEGICASFGATVVALPTVETVDLRISPILAVPQTVSVALPLASASSGDYTVGTSARPTR